MPIPWLLGGLLHCTIRQLSCGTNFPYHPLQKVFSLLLLFPPSHQHAHNQLPGYSVCNTPSAPEVSNACSPSPRLPPHARPAPSPQPPSPSPTPPPSPPPPPLTCNVHVAVPAVVQEEAALGAAQLAILTHRDTPQQVTTTNPGAASNNGVSSRSSNSSSSSSSDRDTQAGQAHWGAPSHTPIEQLTVQSE